MKALAGELKRLERHVAADEGGRRAGRLHLGLLWIALGLAFLSRTLGPFPGFRELEGSWWGTGIAAALLYLLGRVLHFLFTRVIRPDLGRLAEELDDDHGWRDETSTALGLTRHAGPADPVPGRLPGVLIAQSTGRLRQLEREGVRRFGVFGRRVRIALCLLFAFVLLAPGVDGLLGERGAGTGTSAGLGQHPEGGAGGPPPPMAADWFLAVFVDDPLPVEPLPEDEPAAEKAAEDGKPANDPKSKDNAGRSEGDR